MPRRRPGAIRAEQHDPREWDRRPPYRVPGISRRATIEIFHAEKRSQHYEVFVGATATALRTYQRFLSPPGRKYLYPESAMCPCPGCSLDDVRVARDVLEEILARLPPGFRTELGSRVAALDKQYAMRTLPDPFADRRSRRRDEWWHRRLTG